MVTGASDSSWECTVGALQVDNQSDVGPPVLLQTRLPRVGGTGAGDTQHETGGDEGRSGDARVVHLCVVRKLDRHLDWYKYIAVSLQVPPCCVVFRGSLHRFPLPPRCLTRPNTHAHTHVYTQEVKVTLHESTLLRILEMVQSVVSSSALLSGPDARGGGAQSSRLFSKLVGGGAVEEEAWWRIVREFDGDGVTIRGGSGKEDEQARHAARDSDLQRIYIENMHLHPVVLHLQFTPTGEIAELNRRLGRAGTGSIASVCSERCTHPHTTTCVLARLRAAHARMCTRASRPMRMCTLGRHSRRSRR